MSSAGARVHISIEWGSQHTRQGELAVGMILTVIGCALRSAVGTAQLLHRALLQVRRVSKKVGGTDRSQSAHPLHSYN